MINILRQLINEMPDNAVNSFTNPGVTIVSVNSVKNMGAEPEAGTLYFGEYSEELVGMKLRSANLLLHYSGDKEDITIPDNCNTIIVFSQSAMEQMLGAAFELLNQNNRLGRINLELLELIRSAGGTQQLLDYGSALLGNPMLLVDVSFGYIASSGMNGVDRDRYQTWYYTIENGIMPSKYISRIMSSDVKYIDSEREDPEIIETYMDNMGSRAYSIKVRQGSDVFGYIKVLVHNRELTAFDREAFLLISKYTGILSSMLIQKSNYSSDPAETLLTSILLQRIPSDRAASALKTHFALKLYKNLYVINIQFTIDPESGDYTSFALKRLKAFFKSSTVVMINGGYVVLYDTNEDKSPFNDMGSVFYTEFIRLLGEIHCSANVSFVFRDVASLLRYYEQTNFCIEYRYMTGLSDPIVRYSEIYEYQMIAALKDAVDIRSLIHPAVNKLIEVDSTYGSNLTETLFTYVNNMASITATSKELYLHYNTVKHRLEKIAELTSFDETDKDEIFRIMLSEKIMELTSRSDIAGRHEAIEE